MTGAGDLVSLTTDEFRVAAGRPIPMGVSKSARGLNFALFSKHSTEAALVLYLPGSAHPTLELPLNSPRFRTGHVWHVEVQGLGSRFEYAWRLDRQPAGDTALHMYDAAVVVLDPYANAVSRGPGPDWRSVHVRDTFDWEYVTHPRIPMRDRVIYEMHVRGFTRHPSSSVAHPGTFRGIVEKIDYLKSLGVTTLELLPVFEFDEEHLPESIDRGKRPYLRNYWGYDPLTFFAPHRPYSADGDDDGPVDDFKTMVRELHRAGIEVFLDVVFNHTGEWGSDGGRVRSFRGIDRETYYLLDSKGSDLDFTGCGNTLNCNHPVVREMVRDALRFWAGEMQVDGFRFDLASILTRGRHGEVLVSPPLIEQISDDPVLADTSIIAEAWDAAGLYQVGRFPAFGRWAEWNGPFRDEVRRFVRGDAGMAGHLATRLAGSSDLYGGHGTSPGHSINFVTAHDGFTLRDLVSYDRKHNEANGEGDRDGSDSNWSWNCGAEGPTTDPEILEIRRRQTLNLLTILFVSQGVPMLLAGDEIGRSQGGNNNAWCQDNGTSWIDWRLGDDEIALLEATRRLIAFRKAHPVLRRPEFLTGRAGGPSGRPDVTWYGTRLEPPDWSGSVLMMHLSGDHGPELDCDVLFLANASALDATFELPEPPLGASWSLVVDTALPMAEAVCDAGCERAVAGKILRLTSRSVAVLRSVSGSVSG